MNEVSKYAGLVSIALVFIGWRVVYQNGLKIATRSETKSLIDGVVGILNDIESLAIDYWLSGRKSRIGSSEFNLLFTSKLAVLHNRLEILKKRNVNTDVIDLALLSTKITLDCEEVDRMQSGKRREIAQEFLDTINAAHIKLHDEFQKIHKPTFGFCDNLIKSLTCHFSFSEK